MSSIPFCYCQEFFKKYWARLKARGVHIAQPFKRFYGWIQLAKRNGGQVCVRSFVYVCTPVVYLLQSPYDLLQYTFKKRGRPTHKSVKDVVEVSKIIQNY